MLNRIIQVLQQSLSDCWLDTLHETNKGSQWSFNKMSPQRRSCESFRPILTLLSFFLDAPSCDIQCDTLNLLILASDICCDARVSSSTQGPSCSSRVKQLVMRCAYEILRPCVATSFPLDAGLANVLRILRGRTLQAKAQKRKVYRGKDPQNAGLPMIAGRQKSPSCELWDPEGSFFPSLLL